MQLFAFETYRLIKTLKEKHSSYESPWKVDAGFPFFLTGMVSAGSGIKETNTFLNSFIRTSKH